MEHYFDFIDNIEQTDSYAVEKAKLRFAIELNEKTKAAGLKQVDLAGQIGVSAAYISKIMRGDANLTIESMVKLTKATGCELHVHIADKNHKVRWFDVAEGLNRAHQYEGFSMPPPESGVNIDNLINTKDANDFSNIAA